MGIKDIIDIILVAFVLYETYKLMKGTGASNIFVGLLAFVLFWFLISRVFKLQLMGAILDRVISVGAIALIVIFQNEIRRFFSRIGSRQNWTFFKKIQHFFKSPNGKNKENTFPIMKVVLACRNMARTKTGALIVIARNSNLREYIESGDVIDADINTRLIENIFFKNSPLHDGAMIISDERITSAGSILPVSQNPDIPRHLGLRHRSALGITERTDALAIVVSEETGTISIAMDDTIDINVTAEQLERILAANTS